MTGGTSGLGKYAALKLASQGKHLIVLARSLKKGQELKTKLANNHPDSKGSISIIEADMNSLSSILSASEEVKKKWKSIDMLILNAGIMAFERRLSKDGIEETFQVNLLAPILLTEKLSPLLSKNANSKIIFTASGLHQGRINFEDIEFEKGWSAFKSYRQSKLGIILMTRLLAPKYKPDEIGVFSQHPGLVRTDLGKEGGLISRFIFWSMGKGVAKGAENLLFLCNTKNELLKSGEYYANNKVKSITKESYDMEMAQKLSDTISRYLAPFLAI